MREILLNYNLQFFAEDEDAGAGENGKAAENKAFTQADVDNLIKKRLERERKNLPNKEELEAFRQWKASQSENTSHEEDSEGQEDQEQENQGEVDTEDAGQEGNESDRIKQLEQQLKQVELDHALDYAIKESGAKSAKLLKAVLDMDKIYVVNGSLTGFEEQIEMVREEYSYLFGEGNRAGSWGQRQKGNDRKTDPVEAAFLKKNPGLKI